MGNEGSRADITGPKITGPEIAGPEITGPKITQHEGPPAPEP